MKKLFAMLLAVCVTVSLFAVGCAKEEAPEATVDTQQTVPEASAPAGIELPDVPF